MAGLKNIEGYDEPVINICHNDTEGEIVEIEGLYIQFPEQPPHEEILYHDLPKEEQRWVRAEPNSELMRLKSMDDWATAPKEFKRKHMPYIEEEFRRRREGLWIVTGKLYI